MKYQKWLFGVVVFGLSIAMQASGMNQSDTFTIAAHCDDALICTQEVGPYSQATASVCKDSYVATGADNTCCQLASDIQTQVCNDGHDSKGVVITCN